ncbi:DUF1002 domain-containing protein [Peribacillus frigoritolerans]|jgi:uncharacterized protein YpuA (DUF1002 family)|uniref:DUF1002 domain-containing protein n=2 Tax=Bacillaceae TaxID=186817 RepID=A0AAW9NHU0_9BACI|nr:MULTISPECIES: DUF1002 domain-containing protein [Peribacillus]MDP9740258.1 uncharacterized protein YpuA (DUF1002 family) [Bacillus sp. B2I3]MEC0274615.1 DUF1002 domain-containing protein [Peribacillus castrilensis]MCK2003305.1 DUF1002 domain-containing protein [Peribacillus frigoritolerans]MCK2016603.1 DUF1002 domain-containing protein [Peribacillus frigoritolerans]MCP1494261.1 uncharacterized protein YpuA (DUF1002 family) [Peribacillus frigoritolerans]
MKKMNKWVIVTILLCLLLPYKAFADAAVGEMIVTLGENLTNEQKNMILSEMKAPNDVEVLTVTNAEEHEYLGDYIASRLIGTKAISSSAITLEEKGTGLKLESKNINWVSDEMYINALATAGVKDATVYVTAPIPVSGTAALTGVIKAYEISADKKIPEDVKQAANEEMVKTAKLGDEIGTEEASALVTKIKEEMAANPPANTEEVREVVESSAKDLGIALNEDQVQSLIDLFNKLKELNIDWNAVGDQLTAAKDKLSNFLESEEGQSFLDKLKEVFSSLIDAIKSLFS